jgi:hypothetical protein
MELANCNVHKLSFKLEAVANAQISPDFNVMAFVQQTLALTAKCSILMEHAQVVIQ